MKETTKGKIVIVLIAIGTILGGMGFFYLMHLSTLPVIETHIGIIQDTSYNEGGFQKTEKTVILFEDGFTLTISGNSNAYNIKAVYILMKNNIGREVEITYDTFSSDSMEKVTFLEETK